MLLSLQPPAWHLRHSRAVAETAGWLALRAATAGVPLDRRLAESAALLHDIDKLDSVKPHVEGLAHARGAAAWLADRGYAELGPVIAGHPVTLLADGAWFEEWLATASPEALIVSYADKRAGQRLESLGDRFASWRRRYPPDVRAERPRGTAERPRGTWDGATIRAVEARAARLEERVCALAEARPGEVRRLPWTGRAVRTARGS